jgi:hypothetical protein
MNVKHLYLFKVAHFASVGFSCTGGLLNGNYCEISPDVSEVILVKSVPLQSTGAGNALLWYRDGRGKGDIGQVASLRY